MYHSKCGILFEKDFKVPNLSYQALNLLFLPEEIIEIKQILSNISELLKTSSTFETTMSPLKKYAAWLYSLNLSINGWIIILLSMYQGSNFSAWLQFLFSGI